MNVFSMIIIQEPLLEKSVCVCVRASVLLRLRF